MGAFRLSKWYMDCVSEDGEVVIAYAAQLKWRAITLHYASILTRFPGADARTQTSMRATPLPAVEGDVLSWSAPNLELAGRWSSLGASEERTIFDSRDGAVKWHLLSPRAPAEITLGDRTVRGHGYAEHLELTIEPWQMPIDELRWGRFVGARSSLVWIDWRGAHSKRIVLLDGAEVERAAIDERSVVSERGDVKLDIEEGGSLRSGAIGATALAQIPGIERFPLRILAVDERKWCAHGTLKSAQGDDHGWVIHEIVRWPEADKKPDRRNVVGKFLYALAFAVVLPALLVVWARATEDVVHAPVVHHPALGWGLVGSGALLMIAGWFGLWRDGGGLPMNAFPPPRLATRGAYALFAHPIYVGFGAICFGVSIAFGSASGLWLVSPSVALGAVALVLGYETHDLEKRFGAARVTPFFGLAPAADAPPTIAQRASAFILALSPWIALSATRASVLDVGVYVLALGAPFVVGTQRALRALVLRALLAMPLVLPLHLLVPSITPSFLAILALLAAGAWASRASRPLTRALGSALGLVLAAGDVSRAGALGFAASVACYVAVANADLVWRGLRGGAERIANSWHETRIGPVRIINHGVWAGLASFGGILIIGTLMGPGHFAAIMLGALGGLLGAGLWAQTIEGSAALSRPYGFYGGLLGICLAALAAPWLGTPLWLLLGAVVVAGPYIQAMGRLRCLVQGCCHGSETSEAVGIRFHHPRSRVCRLAHLDNVPIHATQLYSILWNVVTLIVVARLWSVHAALHFIGGVYLILNGVGRFCEEAYRGEPQTPIIARLRLYQWVALFQVVGGALVTSLASSGPAPTPRFNVAALVAASIFGVIYWFALGVDFPESNRRLSRLA